MGGNDSLGSLGSNGLHGQVKKITHQHESDQQVWPVARFRNAECQDPQSWQKAAGTRLAPRCIGDERALVMEVGQEGPPLHHKIV